MARGWWVFSPPSNIFIISHVYLFICLFVYLFNYLLFAGLFEVNSSMTDIY